MKALNDDEINEVIQVAYDAAERSILEKYNKKDFEDINIQINLEPLDNGFDIDIEVNLDTDMRLPDDFSDMIIDNSLSAVDEYIEERNKGLEEI